MSVLRAKFHVGQTIRHDLFHYRGVIVDADPVFQGSEDWYDQVARSRPPKDKPWYRVLVHEAEHETYVAERHLAPDESKEPISHPLLDAYFSDRIGEKYLSRNRQN